MTHLSSRVTTACGIPVVSFQVHASVVTNEPEDRTPTDHPESTAAGEVQALRREKPFVNYSTNPEALSACEVRSGLRTVLAPPVARICTSQPVGSRDSSGITAPEKP